MDSADTAPQPSPPSQGSTAQADEIRSGAIELIISLSRPADVPRAWAWLQPDTDVRQLQCTSVELLAQLRGRYSDEDLRRSQIVVGKCDNLRLNPVLGPQPEKFLIWRSVDGVPANLISGRGQLAVSKPPCMLYLDRSSPVRICNAYVLLLPTVDDVLIARANGFHSTTIAGLEQASAAQLRAIFSGSVYTRRCLNGGFVLPTWKLAAMVNQPPPEVLGVINQLSRANERLEIDVEERFCVWRPTPGEFEEIRDAANLRDRDVVRKSFLKSLFRSTEHPPDWGQLLNDVKLQAGATLVDSRRQLMAVKFDPANPASMRASRQARQLYENSLRCRLVEKCFAAADEEEAPIKSILFFLAGQFAEQLIQRDDLLCMANECASSPRQFEIVRGWDAEKMDMQLKSAQFLLRLQHTISK